MYKITNIYEDERGFEFGGKVYVLSPKESVMIEKLPLLDPEIFLVKKIDKKEKIEEPKVEEPKIEVQIKKEDE
jgi:hypothetical protein